MKITNNHILLVTAALLVTLAGCATSKNMAAAPEPAPIAAPEPEPEPEPVDMSQPLPAKPDRN